MADITLRSTKGTALTFVEADDNFSNLNSAKLESISEDTGPALGGSLDIGVHRIYSTNGDTIDWGGGQPVTWRIDNATGAYKITSLFNPAGGGIGFKAYDFDDPLGILQVDIDGTIRINGLTYPNTDGTVGQSLVTDGAGGLQFATIGDFSSLSGDLDVGANSIVTSDEGGFIQFGNPLYITGADLTGNPTDLYSAITGDVDSTFVLLSNGADFASPAMFISPEINNPQIYFAMTVDGSDVLNIKDNLVTIGGELMINNTEYDIDSVASILKTDSEGTTLFLQNGPDVNVEIQPDRIRLNQPLFVKGLALGSAAGDPTLYSNIGSDSNSVTFISSNAADFSSPWILLAPEGTDSFGPQPSPAQITIGGVGGSSPITIKQGEVSVNVDLQISGTLNGLSYPSTDGTVGQVLTTDGAGGLSFADAGGGFSPVFTDLQNSDILVYDEVSLSWVNSNFPTYSIAGLEDTMVDNPQENDVLVYDSINFVWRNSPIIGDISAALAAING